MKATLAQPEANRLFSCSIKDYEELSERVADVARLVKGMEDKQKEYRLGVLLVHGIGRQPSGEALVRWGDVLLQTIRRATQRRTGSSSFLASDLKNPSHLAKKLTARSDPVSKFVWTQFSDESQRMLADTASTLEQKQAALVEGLNKILKGELIYSVERFAEVKLSPETKLEAKNPRNIDRTELNRLLLEDAYPQELIRDLNWVETIVGPALGLEESRPASAVVRLRDGKHEERWLLADGWWADAFLPPSYRELVSWSVKAIPWAFAMHIAQRFWQSDQDTKQNGAKQGDANPNDLLKHPGALILAIGEMSVALAFAPLFVILLALALILGLLPIPQLRTFILAAQGNLVSTVGDCFAFVESPVRAALIRTRILNGLEWLKERCEQTIMVAHSQGAAVVLDSLGAIGVAKDDGSPRFEELGSNQMPDALVTFGAGTNQLAGLKTLTAGLPSKIGPNPVFYALWLLIFTISTIGWLGTAMLSHQTSIKQVLVTVGLLLGSVVLYGLIVGGISNVVARFGKRANDTALKKWATDEGLTSVEVHKYLTAPEYAAKREELLLEIGKKRKERILIPVLLWTMLPLVVGFVWLAETSKLPIFPVSLIGLASLFLLMLIFGILLMKAAVTTVRMPPGLRCWIDIFASADPVPNGRTRIVPSESGAPKSESRFKSIPIWNLGSLFADHTAYWDNLDGFVLRVARACAETARSPWKNKLPPESSEVDERAKWRVGWLRLARWAIQASWLGGGAALWIWHGKDVPMPFSLPGWLPAIATSAARLALFAAAIALAARGSCGVFQLIWGIWARSEQKTVLAHQPLGGEKFWSRKELWPLVGMGMVVTIFIVLALAAVRDDLSLTNTSELVSLVLVFLSPAALLILLLIRLRPAPQVAQRETEAAQRSRLTSAEPLGS